MAKITHDLCEMDLYPFPGLSEEMGWVGCCMPLGHEGDVHEGILDCPCMTCGGIDLHYDWCPVSDKVGDGSFMLLRFDEEGWYWCIKVVQA